MRAHSHWPDNDDRIAWNAISRVFMAARHPNDDERGRVEALARARGVEDAEVGERGDYEDGLTDSRYCLLSILDTHSEDDRARLKPAVEETVEACRSAYGAAWGGPRP